MKAQRPHDNLPSLRTSHRVQWPLYLVATVLIWLVIISINVLLSHLPSITQQGRRECQTRLWQCICCPFATATSTTASAASHSKWFRVGSVKSHFMAFSGVIESNSAVLSRMARSTLSLRTVTAVPNHVLPLRVMASFRPTFFPLDLHVSRSYQRRGYLLETYGWWRLGVARVPKTNVATVTEDRCIVSVIVSKGAILI